MLIDETWTSASHAAVCLAFLRAEWKSWPQSTAWHDRRLIDAPNLDDLVENSLRRLILGSWREGIVGNIPGDTTWSRVASLRDAHLSQLLVIGSNDWRDARGP